MSELILTVVVETTKIYKVPVTERWGTKCQEDIMEAQKTLAKCLINYGSIEELGYKPVKIDDQIYIENEDLDLIDIDEDEEEEDEEAS